MSVSALARGQWPYSAERPTGGFPSEPFQRRIPSPSPSEHLPDRGSGDSSPHRTPPEGEAGKEAPYFIPGEAYLHDFLAKALPRYSFDVRVGQDSNSGGGPNSRTFGSMRSPFNGNKGELYVDGTIGEGAENPGSDRSELWRTALHELYHAYQLAKGRLGYDLSTVEEEADRNSLYSPACFD